MQPTPAEGYDTAVAAALLATSLAAACRDGDSVAAPTPHGQPQRSLQHSAAWLVEHGVAQALGRALASVLRARPADPTARFAAALSGREDPPSTVPSERAEPAADYIRRHGISAVIATAVAAVAADRPQDPVAALAATVGASAGAGRRG
eukprot:TRINITY_DN61579_c0_g1_i1.p1 TRINITY_DN61579_c0_g1~~TRINITY_DN61579_c0_g1_i1.p1  ORF type:complete len:174 (+),score=50.66 TRINITY_DN61579_c0_g1_i1:77-523(+)